MALDIGPSALAVLKRTNHPCLPAADSAGRRGSTSPCRAEIDIRIAAPGVRSGRIPVIEVRGHEVNSVADDIVLKQRSRIVPLAPGRLGLSGAATWKLLAAIRSDISLRSDTAQPFVVVLIFSCIGLAISLIATRYGLNGGSSSPRVLAGRFANATRSRLKGSSLAGYRLVPPPAKWRAIT
jgi:hypothetical protein